MIVCFKEKGNMKIGKEVIVQCKDCKRVYVFTFEEVIEEGLNVDDMDYFWICGMCDDY
jgi:hypothetical protein|tara:strand:- start:1537 stop:1710 length:174 start_codon:yes stop_codon:yes gene_type:complete